MSHIIKKNTNSDYKSYLRGFIFSIILTIIPFYMLLQGSIKDITLIIIIITCGIIQILIHMVYFLHLNTSSEQQWNIIALLFTIIIVGILIVGSLWIMCHLKYNLMNHKY